MPLLVLLGLLAAPLPASRGTVVILRPVRASVDLVEAATRLGSELRASGFQVRIRERHPDRDVLAYEAGAVMALQPPPVAAISVSEADGLLAAALWRVEAATGKPIAWSVSVKDAPKGEARSSPPAVLAVRAVELLHASLTGVEIDAPRLFPPPTPPPKPPAAPPPAPAAAVNAAPATPPRPAAPPPRFDDRVTVSLGPALFGSAAGFGPTAAPRLTLGFGQPGGVRIRLGAVGLVGGAVEVGGEGGRAALRQSLAGADVGWTFRAGRPLQPLVFAGAGLYHARVEGEARPSYSAGKGTLWAATARAGGGLALRLGERVAALLEAEAIVAEPALRVRIADADVGRAGRPILLVALALASRL